MAVERKGRRLMTADQFLRYPHGGSRDELVRGKVEMSPDAGPRHALVASNLNDVLWPYVLQHNLGRVFPVTGYALPNLPNTVRGPDVSFVRADLLPADGIGPKYLRVAPDLAVEILSPTNRPGRIKQKVDDYLVAGTRLVWIIDPKKWTVQVIPAGAPPITLSETDSLDGGDVVPGFRCPVSALFKGAARG